MTYDKTNVWYLSHAGLQITVKQWGVERAHKLKPLNNGHGIWNYYIFIPERLIGTDAFEKLWLEDKVVESNSDSKGWIYHDYMSQPFADVEWHCGITFYNKHGHTVGHRMVELGCDYNHLYDQERGYGYTLEEVVEDAKNTANQLAKLYNIKPPTKGESVQ
jgi:hypothetical protein